MDNLNTYNPVNVSAPGDTLREMLAEREMSQVELARRMGRPERTISEIINGKAAIKLESALQLESVLGASAAFWINREARYRESLARVEQANQQAKWIEWMTGFPVREMCRREWIADSKSKPELLKNLLAFFGVASPEAYASQASIERSRFRRSEGDYDAGALASWLRKGTIEAIDFPCSPYSEQTFRERLDKIRSMTVQDPAEFLPNLKQQCADAGVALVLIPRLKRTKVSGATSWLSPRKAVIQLSLRYRTNDHFWFTFFHEAYHVLYHPKKDIFLETDDRSESIEELKADAWAADFLIPADEYATFVEKASFSEPSVKRFAKRVGVAKGIVVGRLQHDRLVGFNRLNHLKQRYVWE